ncbi:Protein TRM32 [Quillaja saponaria]|uniref:Protein TRM32 n=1 Tax=Quillaja saponaria TaxID=32244 RepID=A0AAD7L3R5_QUISA|nr:Protein TRM32 [Quillaja saponaria]
MGKQMRNKQSASAMSFENAHPSNPRCAWSILHIIRYNHWRQVKKRLVHRKLSSGRTSAGSGIPINDDASGSGKTDEHDDAEMINSNVHDKVAHSTPAAKHSVRSRIKALITDELSKKKGRHKRSSTCPERSQLTRTDSIHHLEHSDLDPLADMVLIDGSPKAVPEIIEEHLSINESDPVPPMFSEEPSTSYERCLECGIMFTSGDKAGYNLAHKHQPSEGLTHFQEMLKNENQDILENKSINARILATDAPAHHFKDFLDALDIINVNKDLLLKLLQDPGSPLAQHFHNQHAFTAKMGLTKSVSFPLRGSSSREKGFDPSILIKNLAGSGSTPYVEGLLQIGSEAPQSAESKSTEFFYRRSMSSSAGYKVDGILSFNQAMAERGYNPTSCLARGQNQVVTKRFKNLRQKIKHVIRESRKERRRITMDAILHKIPRGHELPKESKKESAKEGKDSPASGYESDLSSHSITKRQMHRMRRTSSLNESLDRYCQLYETIFNREAKHANF